MNADTLRTILLVKAIEQHDADGSVLTVAEREAATREALRQCANAKTQDTPEARTRTTWRALGIRAGELYARLEQRHPVVVHSVTLERSIGRAALVLLALAFVLGCALSLLDSRVRIEIVAFPLLGLVLWNFAVYFALVLSLLRRRDERTGAPGGGLAQWPGRWAWRRAAALIRQSAFYHRPLAAALRRYADEWWPIAQPLLWRQGTIVFHAGAAAIALGLVAGYYIRGIGFEYRAGWESTFLGPGQVHLLLHLIYGPAAALTHIALPADPAQIDALRWRDGAGGGPAATWIHLMAVTALLYVILPRSVLAVLSTLGLARASRNIEPPESLLTYARNVLAGGDIGVPAEHVRLTSYAYRPSVESVQGACRLLATTWGAGTQVDVAPLIEYGAEDRYARPAEGVGVDALLFSLAATPEVENHGAVLARAIANGTAARRVLVLVDEAPYLASMQGDPSLASRIEERRSAWRTFAASHGVEACLVDLSHLMTIDDALARNVRQATRGRVV
jgi:hypothetical protein